MSLHLDNSTFGDLIACGLCPTSFLPIHIETLFDFLLSSCLNSAVNLICVNSIWPHLLLIIPRTFGLLLLFAIPSRTMETPVLINRMLPLLLCLWSETAWNSKYLIIIPASPWSSTVLLICGILKKCVRFLINTLLPFLDICWSTHIPYWGNTLSYLIIFDNIIIHYSRPSRRIWILFVLGAWSKKPKSNTPSTLHRRASCPGRTFRFCNPLRL